MSLIIRSAQTLRGGLRLQGSSGGFNGLILYLDAGNNSSYPGTGSTWIDISGSGNDASLQGSVPWTSAGAQSYFTFDAGVAQTGPILPNTAYTKVAIFRVAGVAGNIISGGFNGNNDHAFWGFDTPYLQSGHNGSWSTVIDNIDTIPSNQWVFGAVTFNTTTGWRLYLQNHTPATSPNTDTFGDTPAVVEIGGFAETNFLNGDIAVAMVYNRVLSDAEIADLYSLYQPRFSL